MQIRGNEESQREDHWDGEYQRRKSEPHATNLTDKKELPANEITSDVETTSIIANANPTINA